VQNCEFHNRKYYFAGDGALAMRWEEEFLFFIF